jgi:hypothetical protein
LPIRASTAAGRDVSGSGGSGTCCAAPGARVSTLRVQPGQVSWRTEVALALDSEGSECVVSLSFASDGA